MNDIYVLPSEAIHQRVFSVIYDISDITNHSTDIYLSVQGQ